MQLSDHNFLVMNFTSKQGNLLLHLDMFALYLKKILQKLITIK